MAIRDFASRDVERFFTEGSIPRTAGWSSVARIVARKLDLLDFAEKLSDLASQPGNRLESLKGTLAGFRGIRVNDRWRVVFRWTASGPTGVDVVDYH